MNRNTEPHAVIAARPSWWEGAAAYRLALVLLAAKLVLIWVGFTRVPMMSNNDEVLMVDQAATLARGEGLRAASFSDLKIGEMYAHHPPVYSWLMAGVFKVAGINAVTVRAPSVLAYAAFHLVFLALLARLLRRGWISPSARTIALLLQALEPVGFVYARFGRIDPFAMLFSGWAFLCLFPPRDDGASAGPRGKRLLVSAVLMGLALSCYIGAAFAGVGWGIALLLLCRRRLATGLLMAAMPMVVFAILWIAAYGKRSWEGIAQMREISQDTVSHQLGFGWMMDGLKSGDYRLVWQSGAIGLLIALALTAASVTGAGLAGRAPGRRAWPRWLWAAAVPALCWILMIGFVGGGRGKLIIIFPMVFVAAALTFDIAPGWLRKTTLALALVSAAAGVGTMASYTALALRHWTERSPARFETLLREIPPTAKVAAVPQLWLSFQMRNQPVRIIDFGFGPDHRFWTEHPEALRQYDFVLLNQGHPLLLDVNLAEWSTSEHDIPDFKLVELKRHAR